MPKLRIIKEGDSKRFLFNWIFFKAWSLPHVTFEVALVVDTFWGIGVIGLLPYLRWAIAIPLPHM